MDFTKYSFTNLVARVTQLVQQTDGFGNAYISSTGQMLIQAVAQMTDQLNYMLERRTQESYLPTARIQSSIYALASQFGYRPRRPVSANGEVSLQITNSAGVPIAPAGEVRVPAYTPISFGGNSFVNTSDIIVVAGQTGATLNNQIIEGTLQTTTFDPTDVSSTLYNFGYILVTDYSTIEEDSIQIFDADGNTYLDVIKQVGSTPAIAAISFAKPDDKVYDIRITNQGLMIIFGDGVFGFKPASHLTVQWIKSAGTSVNIVQTGLAFQLASQTLTDNLNVTPPNSYYYVLTNTTGIINALDAETPDHVKVFAPDYIRSADRAVIDADYEFWVKRSGIGGIVDAAVYGQNESGLDPYNMNNVYVVYLTEGGIALDNTDLQALRSYMKVYNTLTAHMVMIPASVLPTQINFRINRNPQLTMANSQLYDIINQALADFFVLQEGSLGETIYLSDLIAFFKDYEANVNGNMIKIATFVTIVMFPMYQFSSPESLQTVDILVTRGTTADQYVLNINGHQYLYTQSGGDTTAAILAGNIRDFINGSISNTYVTCSVPSGSTLRIATNNPGTSFTISNDGTTVPTNFPLTVTILVPASELLNPNNDQLFVPGTVQIVNATDRSVLATDDGLGNIYNGTFDYVTGELVIPQPPTGTYLVRFQQNTDQNLIANPNMAFSYSPPKAAYSDTTELLSTITIL